MRKFKIQLIETIDCEKCSKIGQLTCRQCNGDGEEKESPNHYYKPHNGTCRACNGTGKVECPYCKGQTTIDVKTTIPINDLKELLK